MRVGLDQTRVDALRHDELANLIGVHHRDSTSKQRADFAQTLIDRKAALAAVAHEMVRAADPATLSLVGAPSAVQGAHIWAQQVRPEVRRVAAVAAVIGMGFRIPALARLARLDIEPVVEAIDELLDAGMIVAEQRPDEFTFRHVLIHGDFDAVLDRGERRRLHLRASSDALAVGDIHAHAIHLVEAGAIVANELVVEALLASARQFKQHGSYREAVEAFTRARRYTDIELSVNDLLSYAGAVASGGGDGWELRSAAFEKAMIDNDADDGLEAAITDVLRTEDIMGDPRRVKMLEKIDPAALAPSRRALHAAALSRELGMLGELDLAVEIAEAAMVDAVNPNDRFLAWLGSWSACRALPVSHWPNMPADIEQISQPELVARLAQVRYGQALLRGNHVEARRHLDCFESHPSTKADSLRRWHASLGRCTMAFINGDWQRFRHLADAAFTSASEQGITAAFSARFAQEFLLLWVEGTHGDLLSELQAAPPDVNSSLLAQAAFAITLAEHDEHLDQARQMIGELAEVADSAPMPFSHPTAALLASAPDELLSNDTTTLLQRILAPHNGLAIIAGATLVHLGPASLSLSRVAQDPDERVRLLRQAIEESDRWNLPTWSVRSRLDLQLLVDDPALTAETAVIAQGTSLQALLPG